MEAFLANLDHFPHRHAVALTLMKSGREIRQTIFKKNYVVYFEVRNQVVVVFRVRHGARKPLPATDFRDI
jgi:plasmid stabilization system protein ParE